MTTVKRSAVINIIISVNYDSTDSVADGDECALCVCCSGCVRQCTSCSHGGQEEATESLLRVLGSAESDAVKAATEYMKKEAEDEAEEDSNEESEESEESEEEEEEEDDDENLVCEVFNDGFELVESEDE